LLEKKRGVLRENFAVRKRAEDESRHLTGRVPVGCSRSSVRKKIKKKKKKARSNKKSSRALKPSKGGASQCILIKEQGAVV